MSHEGRPFIKRIKLNIGNYRNVERRKKQTEMCMMEESSMECINKIIQTSIVESLLSKLGDDSNRHNHMNVNNDEPDEYKSDTKISFTDKNSNETSKLYLTPAAKAFIGMTEKDRLPKNTGYGFLGWMNWTECD